MAPVEDGFAVTVRAPDRNTAEEIFRRADALMTQVARPTEQHAPETLEKPDTGGPATPTAS